MQAAKIAELVERIQVPSLSRELDASIRAPADGFAERLEALRRLQADIGFPRVEALASQADAIIEQLEGAAQPSESLRQHLEELTRRMDEALKAPILESLERLRESVSTGQVDAMKRAAAETARRYEDLTPDLRRAIKLPSIEVSTAVEWALFDQQARELMDMSGEEFRRRWESGEFTAIADDPDHTEIMRLASMMPLSKP